MPKFSKHIFVCTNQRDKDHPRGSCDPHGEGKLQKKLKKRLAEHGVRGTVRANKAGCLDQCEHGPTIVVYPDEVWYGRVSEDDLDEIVASHIVGGKPVERLILPDECLNTNACPHKPRPSKSASSKD
jgi:(2Fe-2S) ferredoxin